jgi:hypothetical protein
LTPEHIRIHDGSAELVPADEAPAGDAGAYTAPEVAAGAIPDARSDIFSFGAVLFHMLTGRDPETEGASTGSPAADRIIGPCLAKSPDARTPRMQRILLELKLLSAAVRRAGASRREPAATGALRAELRQIEARIEARIAEHERTVAEMQRPVAEAITAIKDQLQTIAAGLAEAQARIGERHTAEEAAEQALAKVTSEFESASEHIQRVEDTLLEVRQRAGEFERSVTADLLDLEKTIKTHEGAIESARTAVAQTDDLVERVVEALESLQTAVLDQGEAAADRASFAVN